MRENEESCCVEQPKSTQQSHEGGCHSGDRADHEVMVLDYKKRFFISMLLTVPVLLLSPMIQELFNITELLYFSGSMVVLFGLSTVIYFYGGWPFFKGLWQECSAKNPGMMTLIAVAITVSYVYSSAVVFGFEGKIFFWELVTLIDIMLLGHWIEMKSVMGAGAALEELTKLMPDIAHRVKSKGVMKDVSINLLKSGDKLLVKPGEKVPADAVIVKGESSFNEAMLTGETNPVFKKVGATVIGGSINGEGSIIVRVKHTGDESFISGVIRLVKEAQASKSKTQNLANRAAFWLTIVALTGGAITFVAWSLTPQGLAFAMERTVTVMVITCPHALGLAIPLVVAVSTAIAASNGLLIRDRTAFEQARNVQAIIFDKTGTLTKGEFGVTNLLVMDKKYSEEDVVTYAASVEQHSEHPIAQAIVKHSKTKWDVSKFKAILGKGAEGTVKGKRVEIASPGYLREKKIKIKDTRLSKLSAQAKTMIFVLVDNKLIGAIALADIVRSESKQAIAQLKAMDIKCIMLTGDNQQVADHVAKEIGLDEVFAEVLPEQKRNKISEVQQRGLIVAMTGDGINDAPALAQSDIGIAIGAGTDVAIETADIILVKSNPMDIVSIIGLARTTYNKMIQNLIWATGYNALAIPIAAGVFYKWGIVLSPALGAVFMSLSTIICAINAKLLTFRRPITN
jgi:P-type Cu2+ transporter